MSTAAQLPQPMDADTFLDWSTHQEERYELIDGRPVMMTGATRRHDRIVVNIILALGDRLRGGSCWPSTADVAARMTRGNVRRPDVTVDCSPLEPTSLESGDPTVFFEVLSPSTRSADLVRKANEYRGLPSLRAFVMLEASRAEVSLWARDEEGRWSEVQVLTSLDDQLRLPMIGADLPLSDIYRGVPLDA